MPREEWRPDAQRTLDTMTRDGRRRIRLVLAALAAPVVVALAVATPPGRRLVRAIDPRVRRFQDECAGAAADRRWTPQLLAGYCSVALYSSQSLCTVYLDRSGQPGHAFFVGDESAMTEPYRAACSRIASSADLEQAVSRGGYDSTSEHCYAASLLGDLVACSIEIQPDMRVARRRPDEPEGWDAPLVRGR